MKTDAKTIEFRFERVIPASPEVVFDGWLDPKISGTPWNAAERFLLNAKIDGLFFWHLKGTSHYGRFTAFDRPGRMQHTWVSPNTLGLESLVTVTFKKHDEATLMTLVHSGLPDHELAGGHERGWNYFLSTFLEQFGNGSGKPYCWEEAHPPAKE